MDCPSSGPARGRCPNARIISARRSPRHRSRPWRLGAMLSILLGSLALALALFGTAWFHVTQRAQEFGVRIALGARRTDVLRQVLRERIQVVLIGVIGGPVIALVGSRLV